MVSDHFVKLCGHRPCGGSDTAAKIVYMTLQDHVTNTDNPHPAKIDNKRHCLDVIVIYS